MAENVIGRSVGASVGVELLDRQSFEKGKMELGRLKEDLLKQQMLLKQEIQAGQKEKE